MKVIGTSKEGHLVALTDDELKIIMFGTKYESEMSEVDKHTWSRKLSVDVPISILFTKYRDFNNLKISGAYDSVIAKLNTVQIILEKVELEVLIEQEQIKKQI